MIQLFRRRAGLPPRLDSCEAGRRSGRHCSVKFTVTVMMTGTGTPLSSVGVNCHCLTASSAAWSSSGIDRSTLASLTRPSGPIVASMMTTPCTRADCAIGGYTGLTFRVLVGALMLPPTRTGADGGGGGGGAEGSPPTTPPMVPPGIPPSTPPGTPSLTPVAGAGTSAMISFGASVGAALGLVTGVGVTLGGAVAGAGGGGGGGGGGGAANAIIVSGVGSTSAAISGMMMTAPNSTTCARIDKGTVYQACDPTLIDGSTTSPNISRGTAQPSLHLKSLTCAEIQHGARPRIIVRPKKQCQRTSHALIDTGIARMVRRGLSHILCSQVDFRPPHARFASRKTTATRRPPIRRKTARTAANRSACHIALQAARLTRPPAA